MEGSCRPRRRYGRLPPMQHASHAWYEPTPPGVNVKALLSLPAAVLFPLAGVVLAHAARNEIRRTGERGTGLAIAALVVGYPLFVVWLTCGVSITIGIAGAE